jgi:hypothetical protein
MELRAFIILNSRDIAFVNGNHAYVYLFNLHK